MQYNKTNIHTYIHYIHYIHYLHYIHYITLHCIALHYITLHYIHTHTHLPTYRPTDLPTDIPTDTLTYIHLHSPKGPFPMVPEGDFRCRPKGFQMAGSWLAFHLPSTCVPVSLVCCQPKSGVPTCAQAWWVSPSAFVRVVNLLEPGPRVPPRMEP